MTTAIVICTTCIILTCCFLVKIAYDFISCAKHEMMCIQHEIITIRNQCLIYNANTVTQDVPENLDHELVSKDHLKLSNDVLELLNSPLSEILLISNYEHHVKELVCKLMDMFFSYPTDNVFDIIAVNTLEPLKILSLLMVNNYEDDPMRLNDFIMKMQAVSYHGHLSMLETEYYKIADTRRCHVYETLQEFRIFVMNYEIILEVK